MLLPDWLQLAGFHHGNPFAQKEADSELHLQAYFVKHAAYMQMLSDDYLPYSGLLHAPRGAGKSTMRLMFEAYHRTPVLQRPLILTMIDWATVYGKRETTSFHAGLAHGEELLYQFLVVIAIERPLRKLQDAELVGYLAWMVQQSKRLKYSERRALEELTELCTDPSPYDMSRMSLVQQLKILAELVIAFGYSGCYVLIDRIDELPETAGNWEAGGALIAPLIGNLPANEVTHLAFRYFLPTEIVHVLRRQRVLRSDRVKSIELLWEPAQLLQILHHRLTYYSDGVVPTLGNITELTMRDEIDQRVVLAARSSPRRLLNIGEALFQASAAATKNEDWQIKDVALEAALALSFDDELVDSIDINEDRETYHSDTGVPLLRIVGGKVFKGKREVPGWNDVSTLQRDLLNYLYLNRNTICKREDLITTVYGSSRSSTDVDNLRKLVDRLIDWLEENPAKPQYVQKVKGGGLMLVNTNE